MFLCKLNNYYSSLLIEQVIENLMCGGPKSIEGTAQRGLS